MAAGRIKGITIEIGGDTTKLVSALAKVDNAISKTQSNLRDINKALKFDPTSTALLKDKQVELSRAIDETKQKIQTEKEAYEQLARADKTPENVERMRQLKTQIDLDTAALKDFERQARESASVLGTQMQIAGEKIVQVGEKIKNVGDRITGLGRSMTTHVTVPIATAFGSSIKSAIEWESAFTGVMKTVDETATTTYDDLKDSINEIAKTTASSQNEIAAIMEIAGQLGVSADNITKFTKNMVMLGDTTNLTSEEAAASIAKFANVTNMSLDDVDRLGSAIVDLGNNYATTEADIVSMATRLSGAGHQIGLSQGEILGFAAALSSVGIEAEMGGSAFSKAMVKMQVAAETGYEPVIELQKKAGMSLREMELLSTNDTKAFKELAQSLGMTTTELKQTITAGNNLNDFAKVANMNTKDFVTLYRNDAPAALQAFIKGLGDTETHGESTIAMLQEMGFTEVRLRDTLTRLANSGDLVTNAVKQGNEAWKENSAMTVEAEKRYSTMESQIKQLKARITEVAVKLGETLMPYVKRFIEYIDTLINKWNSLSPAQQEAIVKAAALVAAIGPVLIIVGKLTSAIGSIIEVGGYLTKGIGSLLTFISGGGGLVPAIQGLMAKGTTLMGGIKTLIAGISAISAPVLAVIAVVGALTAAFIYFYQTNDEFRDRVNAAIESVKEVFTAFVEKIKELLVVLMEAIGPVVESIMQYLGAVWELFKTILDLIGSAIVDWINKHQVQINAFLSTMKLIIKVAMDFISNHIKTKLEAIKIIFTTILNTLTNLIKAFTAMLKGDWQSAFEYLKTAAKTALDGVNNYFKTMANNTKDLFKNLIADFKKWGQEMVENLISGISSKIDKVSEPMNRLTSKIKSYIHFTEPDIGPLSDFHTYMPDMINTLVSGINNGIPQVQAAMGNLTKAMVPSLSDSMSASSMTNNNNVNITVYGAQGQDVNELAEIIQDRINAEVYSKGAVFA